MMPPPSLDARRQLLVERAVGELHDAVGLTDGPSAGPRREAATAAAAATVFFTAPPGRVAAVAPRPSLAADRLGVATLTAASGAECVVAVTELTALPIVTTHPGH